MNIIIFYYSGESQSESQSVNFSLGRPGNIELKLLSIYTKMNGQGDTKRNVEYSQVSCS